MSEPSLNDLKREELQEWRDLRLAHIEDTSSGTITELTIKILDVADKSCGVHSPAKYLSEHKEYFVKNKDFKYWVAQATSLHSIYALSESLHILVNTVWSLGNPEDNENLMTNVYSDVPNSKVKTELAKFLSSDNTSRNDDHEIRQFIEEYRHPEVHNSLLKKTSPKDLVSALAGAPRSDQREFIESLSTVSKEVKSLEKAIIEEIRNELSI